MAANLKAGRSLRRGSTDTDAGYALRRYVAETTDGSNTIVPSSPQLNPSSGTDMWLEESPALMPFEKAPASRIPTPEPIDPVERLRKAESQRNALHDAAKQGDDLIVQRLIAEGADINVKDVDGKTALHFAAEEGNESVAQILLEHGADVNAKSLARGIMETRKFLGGRTPLHWAASHGHEGIIRILLDYKADVAAANVTKRTALQEALRGRNVEVARLLIDNGAPLVSHDDEGWTPLHEAASKGCLEIQRILVDKGVDIDAVTTDRNIWHNPRFSHATPLLLAANGGHPACVRHLMNHGANIKAVNAGGEMAIHTGAVDGRINIVRMMLDAGVDIETRDLRFNETPLLKAASTGRSAVIMLLLERGADASATTQIGRDALRHAQLHQRGNDEAAEILKNHLSNQPTRS